MRNNLTIEFPFHRIKEGENMNVLNIILLIIGIFILIMGISWSKKDWINFIVKLILLASGCYVSLYALYLSNILIILNR